MRINIYVILMIAVVILLTNIMRIRKYLKNRKLKKQKDTNKECCKDNIKDNIKDNEKKYVYNDNKKYFDLSIYPDLEYIMKYLYYIHKEIQEELKTDLIEWLDYPGEYINKNNDVDAIKILPMYAYGNWNKINSNKMPKLVNFIKEIKDLKLAYISIIAPNTMIKENRGWGYHSNRVLRCQYSLITPINCYVSVKNDEDLIGTLRPYFSHSWIIYNNSKKNFIANNSDKHLVLLTLDIKRPSDIPNDEDYGDPNDILNIIKYFNKNLKIDLNIKDIEKEKEIEKEIDKEIDKEKDKEISKKEEEINDTENTEDTEDK